MYAYIKGTLEEKTKDSIVIDAGGIGYRIFISEQSLSKLGELGETIKVYTHYHVREDNISLYGFLNNEELKMFELLLQVSGIGAKTAITMLSNITPSQFALAVISNDIKELVKIPGIGTKSAQRMILELKDKLKVENAIEEKSETKTEEISNVEAINEATQALQILGYNKAEIKRVFEKIQLKNASTEDIIKNALKNLAR